MGLGVVGSAIGGIGEGISKGIQDYGNIQQGIVQKAQANKAMEEEKLMMEPIKFKEDPLYLNATPEGKAYFDKVLPSDGVANRRYLQQLAKDEEVKTKLGTYAKESGIKMLEPQVMKLGEEYKAAAEFAAQNQEDSAAQIKAQELNKKYTEAHSKITEAKGDVDKQHMNIAMTDTMREFSDVLNKNPSMKVLAKYVVKADDVAEFKTVLNTLAKSKTGNITSVATAVVAQHEQESQRTGKPVEMKRVVSDIVRAESAIKAAGVYAGIKDKPNTVNFKDPKGKPGNEVTFEVRTVNGRKGYFIIGTDERVEPGALGLVETTKSSAKPTRNSSRPTLPGSGGAPAQSSGPKTRAEAFDGYKKANPKASDEALNKAIDAAYPNLK